MHPICAFSAPALPCSMFEACASRVPKLGPCAGSEVQIQMVSVIILLWYSGPTPPALLANLFCLCLGHSMPVKLAGLVPLALVRASRNQNFD